MRGPTYPRCDDRYVNRRYIGWSFVAVQLILLVALIALPERADWSDAPWLTGLAWMIGAGGGVVLLVAARGLGSSLTPTPVPTEHGHLTTTGLYRLVRHPIYTGVLMIVIGMVIGSSSVAALLLGLVIVGFFSVKARWEEAQLRVRYPEYDAYASTVPRFVPSPFRRP
jgi:protein-S-isoprenylcysteine O-methyltransferase Ste14